MTTKKGKREDKEYKKLKEFCKKNNISYSSSVRSFYFTLFNQRYRISNHSIKESNQGRELKAQRQSLMYGKDIKPRLYHKGNEDIIDITAERSRVFQIYKDIKEGYEVDERGNRIGMRQPRLVFFRVDEKAAKPLLDEITSLTNYDLLKGDIGPEKALKYLLELCSKENEVNDIEIKEYLEKRKEIIN